MMRASMSSTAVEPSTDDLMKPLTLTPEQKRQWEDTMSMMMWTAPGFRHIFYKLLNAQGNTPSEYTAIMSRDVGIAATDAKNIIINPDTFFKMSLRERVYITGHEIIHNVFGDVELLHRCSAADTVPMNDGTKKPFVNQIMQKAMDARINALLNESKIGSAPKEGHFDDKVTGHDSVLDVYGRYYEDEFPDGDQPQGPGPGDNPGGFDNLLPPGKATGQNPQQAASSRNPGQWAVELAAAQTIEQARSQGKMALALKRMFKQLLEPEVPWVDHIETLINRQVGDGGIDWTTPDPWLAVHDFFSPASTGHGAGWIVIWGDTSGSRSDKELQSNMAELAGIMEAVNPQRLTILWCDANISFVDELQDPVDLAHIQARGAGGGGGTDYAPVLDWIEKNGEGDPDLFIGFTDGYVDFPNKPHRFPTIWASSTDKSYPFGQVVRVNKMARAP